jgi:hypothetical protein
MVFLRIGGDQIGRQGCLYLESFVGFGCKSVRSQGLNGEDGRCD